ncbi:cob(I)yrinic acid a,c-diamide adenosyltransferase [uncultured Desulfuromonas sp.]|uniref:cob(I)yrinic acid a,c-diamide adenosyltransferase n=1 Tax=uncultured Desulfuromonas sp. TaxID=181013 RepID=UPI0026349186|nr:cob(I)yrinic acid a,c-diamide adenosyltransferase [uncultured Desulfuromonas sp.]
MKNGPFAGGVRAGGTTIDTGPGLPQTSPGFFVFGVRKMEQGLIQVYTGEGKGKTTAAVGLAVRALGQGLRVLLVRFLKPAEPASGEILFLEGTAGLEILTSGVGIVGARPQREEVERSVRETFESARRRIAAGTFDLVIFDEINNALHRDYLPLAEVLDLLDGRPAGLEIVLTGRNAPAEVIERAALVTRMEKVRHPLDRRIPARRGIEF